MAQLEQKGKIDIFGTAMGLLAVAGWGSGPVFIWYLTGYLDAWSQNLWRYATALVFWLPFLFIAMRRGQVSRQVWKWALIPGIANVVMQCLWGWSFYYVAAGFGSLISRSSLIWTMIFSLIYFSNERPLIKSVRFWLGTILSVAGLIMVITAKEGFTAHASVIGIILMLAASVVWAVYSIAAKIVFKDVDSRIGFSVVCIYTVIGLAILAIIFGRPGQILQMPVKPWLGVIISGILSIALAHTFYYSSMRRLGATIPAVLLQLSPFATLVLSIPLQGETINTWQWAGGVILVAGSILAIWAQQHLAKN